MNCAIQDRFRNIEGGVHIDTLVRSHSRRGVYRKMVYRKRGAAVDQTGNALRWKEEGNKSKENK
jgi:hypothetical protein